MQEENSSRADAEEEEIEGLGQAGDGSWGEYPIDTVLIRTEPRTVFEILRRIEKQAFIMDPEFQRDFIWPEDVQSKLIESVLMRIPLPVFYLAEDTKGRMIVVDGLQRLSTFQRFHSGKLRLKLPGQKELDGKRFSDLSPKLQNRIEDCSLTLYIIDSKVPERARLDIFERVNSGVPLTRQQMRNCLYMGPATRLLRDAASTELFKKSTGESLKISTMRDREFVNRYCAFKLLPLAEYKGDMDDFLAAALRKMNLQDEGELDRLSESFQVALANNFAVFGQHAFRKHTSESQSRSVINASLWDVMSTALSEHTEPFVEGKVHELRKTFYSLMDDEEFIKSVTYGPNDAKKVNHRFLVAQQAFAEVLGC